MIDRLLPAFSLTAASETTSIYHRDFQPVMDKANCSAPLSIQRLISSSCTRNFLSLPIQALSPTCREHYVCPSSSNSDEE